MSRGTALLLAIAVAVALAACGGSNPTGPPGIGPPTGNATPPPTPAPTPTPTPTPAPTPTPTPTATPDPSPTAPPPCGDLFMKIIRPDAGTTVTNDPQVVEANVGHSVVRVDFYYHIDAFGFASGPSSQAAQSPPVLISTRTSPPWRVNWKLPDGCGLTVSLLAVGFDACGGGKDSGLVTVTTCKP